MLWWCIRVFFLFFCLVWGAQHSASFSIHCSLYHWLISCLNSPQTRRPVGMFINPMVLINTIGPHSWKFSSPFLSPRLLLGWRAMRDARRFGARQQLLGLRVSFFHFGFRAHTPSDSTRSMVCGKRSVFREIDTSLPVSFEFIYRVQGTEKIFGKGCENLEGDGPVTFLRGWNLRFHTDERCDIS